MKSHAELLTTVLGRRVKMTRTAEYMLEDAGTGAQSELPEYN